MNKKKYQNTYFQHPSSSEVSPSLVHQFSIDTPSKRWTCDGVTMEYRWSIYRGRTKEKRSFLLENSAFHKNHLAWSFLRKLKHILYLLHSLGCHTVRLRPHTTGTHIDICSLTKDVCLVKSIHNILSYSHSTMLFP